MKYIPYRYMQLLVHYLTLSIMLYNQYYWLINRGEWVKTPIAIVLENLLVCLPSKVNFIDPEGNFEYNGMKTQIHVYRLFIQHYITSCTQDNLANTPLLVATEQRPCELGLACLAQGHNPVVLRFRTLDCGPHIPTLLSANVAWLIKWTRVH